MNIVDKHYVTVTHITAGGAGFGILDGTSDACYIPAGVLVASGVRLGDTTAAKVVDNPVVDARQRTPWMVAYLEPILRAVITEDLDAVAAATQRIVSAGGAWTPTMVYQELVQDDDADPADDPQRAMVVAQTLHRMFVEGRCAKWAKWSRPHQPHPDEEWFSTKPETIDVAEFEDLT